MLGIVEPLEQSARAGASPTCSCARDSTRSSPPTRRAALHRAAAVELRAALGEPPLAELAHHLLHAVPAGAVGEAADAALRAAERAMDLLAFEDASALLERAAKLLEGVAGEERRLFEVLLGLGLARIRAADIQLGKADLPARRRAGAASRRRRALCPRGARLRLRVHAWRSRRRAHRLARGGARRAAVRRRRAARALHGPARGGAPARAGHARAHRVGARRRGDGAPGRRRRHPALHPRHRRPGDVRRSPNRRSRCAFSQEALRLALAAGDKLVALRANLFLIGRLVGAGRCRARRTRMSAPTTRWPVEFRHSRFRWISL